MRDGSSIFAKSASSASCGPAITAACGDAGPRVGRRSRPPCRRRSGPEVLDSPLLHQPDSRLPPSPGRWAGCRGRRPWMGCAGRHRRPAAAARCGTHWITVAPIADDADACRPGAQMPVRVVVVPAAGVERLSARTRRYPIRQRLVDVAVGQRHEGPDAVTPVGEDQPAGEIGIPPDLVDLGAATHPGTGHSARQCAGSAAGSRALGVALRRDVISSSEQRHVHVGLDVTGDAGYRFQYQVPPTSAALSISRMLSTPSSRNRAPVSNPPNPAPTNATSTSSMTGERSNPVRPPDRRRIRRTPSVSTY